VHPTLSITIGTLPWPKWADGRADASGKKQVELTLQIVDSGLYHYTYTAWCDVAGNFHQQKISPQIIVFMYTLQCPLIGDDDCDPPDSERSLSCTVAGV